MRLPNEAHESRPWRISEIAPHLTWEDVWVLPVPGSAGDFQTMLELMASFDPASASLSRLASCSVVQFTEGHSRAPCHFLKADDRPLRQFHGRGGIRESVGRSLGWCLC